MTTDEMLDGLIEREGGFSDDPLDRGGPTKFGITAADLGRWRGLIGPASRDDVQALTVAEARDIYAARYLPPFAQIPYDPLRAQLVDFGVLQGIETAIRSLQDVLGVPVDGVLGERTRAAATVVSSRLVNNALVGARVRLLEGIVDHNPSQLKWLHGWVRRAVSFYEIAR